MKFDVRDIEENLDDLAPIELDFFVDSLGGEKRWGTYYYFSKQKDLFDFKPFTIVQGLSEASGYRIELRLMSKANTLIGKTTLAVFTGDQGDSFLQYGAFINDTTYNSIRITRQMIEGNVRERYDLYQIDSFRLSSVIMKTGEIIEKEENFFSGKVIERR